MKGQWADLAEPGAELHLRVTPDARAEALTRDGAVLRIRVTAPPEDGKANAAVAKLLARALGIPTSRLELIRGATSRNKVFRVAP